MKTTRLTLVGLLLTLIAFPAFAAELTGKIAGVHDGDTVYPYGRGVIG